MGIGWDKKFQLQTAILTIHKKITAHNKLQNENVERRKKKTIKVL